MTIHTSDKSATGISIYLSPAWIFKNKVVDLVVLEIYKREGSIGLRFCLYLFGQQKENVLLFVIYMSATIAK